MVISVSTCKRPEVNLLKLASLMVQFRILNFEFRIINLEVG